MRDDKDVNLNPPNREFLTRGPLFEAVQAFRIFPDSKTFPDLVPKNFQLSDPRAFEEKVGTLVKELRNYIKEFSEFTNEFFDGTIDRSQHWENFINIRGLGFSIINFRSHLDDFVKEHFLTPPVEPKREKAISRGPTTTMEAYIDSVWDVLTRDKKSLPEGTFNSTLIELKYPYVVAGGRFNEIYYWDGYFTGVGLVLSGKSDLFECMVKNYAWLIKRAGFVPNGNRTYYSTRSQPPFYCFMVDILVREKGLAAIKAVKEQDADKKQVIEQYYFEMLKEEYEFWTTKRSIDVDHRASNQKFKMNRYWDDYWDPKGKLGVSPRPEAYHQDSDASARVKFSDSKEIKKKEMEDFFRNIRSAAESGWDFSSRWFRPTADEWGRTMREITTIRTTDIIPVDLNSILYFMEIKLFEWTDEKKYEESAVSRKQAILDLFWDKKLGWFFDYSCENEGQTDVWSLAGAYPLFCQLFDGDKESDREIVNKMVGTLKKRFLKPGGVVTTLFETGQQWDYPNGWAPLQWIVVRGLLNYDERELAWNIARRFTACVGKTYEKQGRIMEKYNVCDIELTAGGGEYEVQHGFGWTNGVIKALMTEFRDDMENDDKLAGYLGNGEGERRHGTKLSAV